MTCTSEAFDHVYINQNNIILVKSHICYLYFLLSQLTFKKHPFYSFYSLCGHLVLSNRKNFVCIKSTIYICKRSKQIVGYSPPLCRHFWKPHSESVFTTIHVSTLIFVTELFYGPSASKFHQAEGAFNFNNWRALSVSPLVILQCQIVYSDVIHCSSIISKEFFLFLDSGSLPFLNLIIFFNFMILIYLHKKYFFWRLIFKTQFKIEYFLSYKT